MKCPKSESEEKVKIMCKDTNVKDIDVITQRVSRMGDRSKKGRHLSTIWRE